MMTSIEGRTFIITERVSVETCEIETCESGISPSLTLSVKTTSNAISVVKLGLVTDHGTSKTNTGRS